MIVLLDHLAVFSAPVDVVLPLQVFESSEELQPASGKTLPDRVDARLQGIRRELKVETQGLIGFIETDAVGLTATIRRGIYDAWYPLRPVVRTCAHYRVGVNEWLSLTHVVLRVGMNDIVFLVVREPESGCLLPAYVHPVAAKPMLRYRKRIFQYFIKWNREDRTSAEKWNAFHARAALMWRYRFL